MPDPAQRGITEKGVPMPGLYLLTPGASVTLQREHLKIAVPPGDTAEQAEAVWVHYDVPLWDIEHVVMTEHINMTMPVVAELMSRDIPVVITARGERILGLCLPPAPNAVSRLAQYRSSGEPGFALNLARLWVEAKILNARRVLQRLGANREQADVTGTLKELNALAEKAGRTDSVETLRGVEGAAAGAYFEALNGFFPPSCPFERRSRRPPHNAANALLSFTYTLMTAEMECQLHVVGLDPAVGFLHEPADRRPSLALDMIEPFRAPVADALALDLLNHGTLKSGEHFEKKEGGVYLNQEGRKKFFVAYERRMNREFLSDYTGERTSLRGEFRKQAVAVKQAIMDGNQFAPFLMN